MRGLISASPTADLTRLRAELTALYPGYMYAARPGARAQFGRILDMIWADTAANTFGPRGELSGAHSRDCESSPPSLSLSRVDLRAHLT